MDYLLDMVIKGIGRICIKGTKPCRLGKSHRDYRNILLKHGIKYHQQSKITLGTSTDPEYDLKKRELKN